MKFVAAFSSFREIDGANYIVFCKSLLKLIQVIALVFLSLRINRPRPRLVILLNTTKPEQLPLFRLFLDMKDMKISGAGPGC